MADLARTKQVRIVTTQDGANYDHVTSSTTFGDLKKELLDEHDLNFNNKKVIVRSTRNELSSDDAVLPVEDFAIFVYPKESKAGGKLPSIESVEKMKYNDLRSTASKLNKENNAGIDSSGKSDNIRANIVAFLSVNETSTKSSKKTKAAPAKVTVISESSTSGESQRLELLRELTSILPIKLDVAAIVEEAENAEKAAESRYSELMRSAEEAKAEAEEREATVNAAFANHAKQLLIHAKEMEKIAASLITLAKQHEKETDNDLLAEAESVGKRL